MAVGDIVDAQGNVITPAAPSQGGGAGGGDDGGAGQAFQYGMVGAVPFGKTLGAAVETAESYLPKALRAPGDAPVDQTGEGWAQRYAENRARIMGSAKDLQEAHPWATVAGSVAPMLAAPEMGTAGWAGYGAASGLGEGVEQGDSAGGILAQTALGGAGGAIGSEASKLLVPASAATRDAVLAAAKRLKSTASPEGVTMPRYSVGTGLTQQLGKIGFSIPGMSTPLREESEASFKALGSAASDAAAGATKESAGGSMKAALKNWIGPVSQGDVDAEYNKVQAALTNPNAVTPLSGTASAARQIIQRRGSLQDPSGALQQVQKALSLGEGTYNDIKALRTSVGQLMDSSNLPADVSGAELKTLYGGLSGDLERAAYTSGGQNAVNAHLDASKFASDTAARREQLTELLGGKAGDDSNEAVYGALKTAAGDTKGADIALLRQARSAVPQQSWDRLSQGMVSTLGRDADGNFSTSRFITDYGKISDTAKDELFAQNTPLRQNLDDLHTVSQQWKHLEKYANPSGSGGHVVGAAALIHGWHAPLETLGMFLGAQQFGKLLATPAGAGAFGAFSRAVGSRNIRAIQQASARVTATAGAQLGAKADPMALASLALHHFMPEAVEGGGAGDQSGNVPQ
jgi:hypothetical protein